uniref:beta strand repeat-containing protein n=3 Tax=Flavobacterium sp. TaxID=239 RepID=UPI004049C656
MIQTVRSWSMTLLVFFVFLGFQSSWGQTTIAIQDFDETTPTWNYSSSPAPYNVSGDIWDIVSSNNNTTTGTSGDFWGIRDLNNSNGGGGFYHELTFDDIDIAAYSDVVITFRYYTVGFDSADEINYKLAYDGGAFGSLINLTKNTSGNWTTVTINVPSGSTSARIQLRATQDGGSDYAGFDDIKIEGTAANLAPTASSVSIAGIPNTTQTLTGSYTYVDNDDAQDVPATTFQWYTATDDTGTGQTPISGATSLTYTLQASDAGQYIAFGVTPAAQGGPSPGVEVLSTYFGPISVAGTPSLTVTEVLSEDNLDGYVAVLTLVNDTFIDATLNVANFTLNNAPSGLTIDEVVYDDANNALLSLLFSGDIDTDIVDFSITIAGAELTGAAPLTSNDLVITALVESLSATGTLDFGSVEIGNTTASQTFSLSGTDLQAGIITLAALSGFEYSIDDISFDTTLDIVHTGGNLAATDIYVRFAPDEVGSFDGSISISGVGASTITQAVTGSGSLGTPTATAATLIGGSSFTANWDAVAGATSYGIDVYEGSSFTLFSENFNNFDGTGFTSSPSSGQLDSDVWKVTGMSDGNIDFGDSSTSGDYARGNSTGNITSGGIHSFTVSIDNNSLGIQPGGSDWTPGTIVLKLDNTTGQTLTSLNVSYKIYVNNDQGRSSSFNFSHSPDDIDFTDELSLDYTSPAGSDTNGWFSIDRSINLTGLSIPDNGSYYLRWSGDDVAGSGSRDEIALDDLVVTSNNQNYIFQDENVGAVTSYEVTGLESDTEYFYVVRAILGANTSANSNEISATTLGPIVWSLGVWSNGTGPTIADNALIEDDFATSGDLEANTLTISATGSFTISGGDTVTLDGALINNATAADFVVGNNANLIQNTNVANTGDITVTRISAPILRLDVTMWSSPVSGQIIKELSPGTLNNRFLEYDSAGSTYVAIADPTTTTMVAGKGYGVRAPNNWSATSASAFTGTFIGTPNNGDYSMSVSGAGSRFYLVGNPYPSSLNLIDFYDGGNNHIGSTIYLYEHTIRMTGTGDNFATYNAAGGGFVSADRDLTDNPDTIGEQDFQGDVKPGQGFFVEAATGAGTINFTNAMRSGAVNNVFFRVNNQTTSQNNSDTFKLKLTSPTSVVSEISLGFYEGASSDEDAFDSRTFATSPLFYSNQNNAKFAIQGKSWPIDNNEVFSLGFKANTAGEYTIDLNNITGAFVDSQLIFIHDQLTNTYHNLSESSYTFISEEGTFDNRLVVVFTSILSNENPINTVSQAWVYEQNNQLMVSVTENSTIKEIVVFDLQGRKLYEANEIQSNQQVLSAVTKNNSVLILQITTQDGAEHIVKTVY